MSPRQNEFLLKAVESFCNLKSQLQKYEYSTHSDDWAMGSEYLLFFDSYFNINKLGNLTCCLAMCKDNKATILRDVSITISPTLFFPPTNGIGIGIEDKNSIESVIKLFRSSKTLFLKFGTQSTDNQNRPTMSKFQIAHPLIVDDLGKLFFNFSGIDNLKKINIPESLKNKAYTLVGVSHETPYARTDNADCILYAEIDNEHDSCAIKVLRLFLPERKRQRDHIWGTLEPNPPIPQHEGIRTYGYISRQENSLLHEYMINHSRILFGRVVNSKINIIGGIEAFTQGELKEYYFPHCLLELVH